jgi:uncharacterized iron-regulated membrane protein
MKLPRRAFQAFWDVHAWLGVVGSLLLHLMFLAGVFALFRGAIEIWQEPGLHRLDPPISTLDARVEAALGPAVADDFWLVLGEGTPSVERLVVSNADDSAETSLYLVTREGPPLAEREGLADFLFHLHYLQLEGASWMRYAGAAMGVLMLAVLVTGVLIQLSRLLRQLHQLRIHKGWRVAWSDLHKVLGVMGLPFQTIYAFTGALILLSPVTVDVHAALAGRAARNRVHSLARFEAAQPAAPHGEIGASLPLDELIEIARRAVPELVIETVNVRGHRRSDGWLVARGRSGRDRLFTASVWVREVDGAVLARATNEDANAFKRASSWLTGVHYAHFASPLVKVLLALLALATCATILSGNVLWLARRADRPHRILERLNVGFGAGVLVAFGATFVASRLVSLSWQGRVVAEQIGFLVALLACIGTAFLVSRERLAGLSRQLSGVAGVLFVATPLLARRWSAAGMFGSSTSRIDTVVAVDLALAVSGILLVVVALRLRRSRGSVEQASRT